MDNVGHYERYKGFYDKQLQILDCKTKYLYCLGSNKSGKTFTMATWIIEQSLKYPTKRVSWLAPTYRVAKIGFDLCKKLLTTTTIEDVIKVNESRMEILMPNKCIIAFVSAEKPQNIYGQESFAVVVDEASRVKKEAYEAMESTTYYTDAQIFMIGNPRFKSDWFYQEYLLAKNNKNTTATALKITAIDAVKNGILSQKVVDQAKQKLATHIFKRDFMAEIVDDGTNPFGLENIDNCIIDMDLKDIKDKTVVKYGIDLAKSTDYTVIVGLNKDNQICYFERFQQSWAITKNNIRFLPNVQTASVLVDSTGVGDPILEDISKDIPNIQGFKYSNSSKCQLIENLAVKIRNIEVTFPRDLEVLFEELENFETVKTKSGLVSYQAHNGHDDAVNALALAVYSSFGILEVVSHVSGNDFEDEEEDDDWEVLDKEKKSSIEWVKL